MKQKKLLVTAVIIGIATIVIATRPQEQPGSCCPGHEQNDPKVGKPEIDANNPAMEKKVSLEKIHSRHLPMVPQSIDNAIKALESDNEGAALAELNKVKQMIIVINEAISKLVKPEFANIKCPIMGSPINLKR